MALDRKEELICIIKNLLGKADDAIDSNQHSVDNKDIINSAKKLVKVTENLNDYITELNIINSKE